jgi:hypothetical protein
MSGIQRRVTLGLALVGWVLAAGCETTTSMSAKSGPEGELSRQASACERKSDRRSECDDEAGCFWDNQHGRCSAH